MWLGWFRGFPGNVLKMVGVGNVVWPIGRTGIRGEVGIWFSLAMASFTFLKELDFGNGDGER